MSALPVLKVPSLDEFKSKLEEHKSAVVVHEEKKVEKQNKLVIAYSKEIPAEVKTLFASLGRTVEFNYSVHSMVSLLQIEFNYLYIDITKEKNRLYLKLHRKELEQMDSIAFCYKFEIDTLQDRSDAWFKAFGKAISVFDMLIGDADQMKQVLYNDKLKYSHKVTSVLKKVFSCVNGH
jgi:hypothetical protein